MIVDRSYLSRVVSWELYLVGLDPARFRTYSTAEGEELNVTTLDSQIPESERYNDADPLKIRCRHCKTETNFHPIHDRPVRFYGTDVVRVSLLTLFDVTEVPLVTLGADMSDLSQGSRRRKYSGTTGETDPRPYLEVLPGVDRVRRFYVWGPDEDDECLWEEMFATRVHWSREL